ncbi:hypothetical protein QYF36_019158 [Acer negundo]|nr:hypothetical protein QYF36_019158 [Acer negundo]
MLRRNQIVAHGEKLRANQDANGDADPTICQLAEEANPTTNLIVRLLEQQNRLLADMNQIVGAMLELVTLLLEYSVLTSLGSWNV